MRGFHNSSSFDPQTLVVLEAAFDEALSRSAIKP
jgi:hypothetical protein